MSGINKYSRKTILIFIIVFAKASFAQIDNNDAAKNYTVADTVIANEWINKAKELSEKAKYDSSNIVYENAIVLYKQLAEKNSEKKYWEAAVFALNSVGWNLLMEGANDSALTSLMRTLDLGLSKLGKNNKEVAQSYNNIGTVYWYDGEYDKALDMYNMSLEIKSNVFGKNSLETAVTLNNIGLTYHKMGEYEVALGYYQQALEIRVPFYGENHGLVAANYNNIGNVFLFKGDYYKALEFQLKALSIRKNVYGESNPDVATSYNNIGLIYGSMGDYDKEIEFYQKSLAIRLQIFGENHPGVALVYGNIGIAYEYKQEFDKALEYYNKALTIRLKVSGEDHPSVGLLYHNMGDAYRSIKDFDKAFESLNKALQIRLKKMGPNHPDVAYTYSNYGNLFFDTNKYEEARNYYFKSYSVWSNLFGDKHPEVGLVYYNIARTYEKQSNPDSALIYCQLSIKSLVIGFDDSTVSSMPGLDNVSSGIYLLKTLRMKANLLAHLNSDSGLGSLELSLTNFQLASDLVDKIRSGIKTEGSKLNIIEQAAGLYSDAVKASLRLHSLTGDEYYKQQAFNFIERGKSAVLAEGLAESKAKEFANIPAEIIEQERDLRTEIAFYNTQLQKLYQQKENKDSVRVLEYESKLFSLKNQYEQFINTLEKDYPEYFRLKYDSFTASIEQIHNALNTNEAVLNYFLSDNTVIIALISREGFEIIETDIPGNFFEIVKEYYTSIIKSENEKYISAGNQLSNILINPVLNKLQSKQKLIIIPHSSLFKLPFEAMFTKQENTSTRDFTKLSFLVKDFDISYHYSASLYLRGLERTEQNKNRTQKNFIGFAPVFPKDESLGYSVTTGDEFNLLASADGNLRSVTIDGKKFDELKYSEWEVNSIIDLFTEYNSQLVNAAYFYSDASEEIFKQNVKDYKLVHIASHSFMNEEQPDISGVVFAQPDYSEVGEDGILYAGETYNLELNADLVVLSSCESGLGKLFRGEGMMALTRGFLYSGTSNIIFSLWKIPDKHTSELMVEFYKQMISGKAYSEALRLAKLKLIENNLTARPRSWAGFLLIGVN
jgi:CHAT domain-containing protein/tetratricopeptide (TPR) repeat protein